MTTVEEILRAPGANSAQSQRDLAVALGYSGPDLLSSGVLAGRPSDTAAWRYWQQAGGLLTTKYFSGPDAAVRLYQSGTDAAKAGNVVQSVANTPALAGVTSQIAALPPLPHPDASNQAIGPNLGGSDAVSFPGEISGSTGQAGGFGGILLLGGALLLVFALLRK